MEPMPTFVEVWTFAADVDALWLASGADAWRTTVPVAAGDTPWAEVDLLLDMRGVLGDVVLKQGSSYRWTAQGQVDTFVAVLVDSDCVPDRWRQAQRINLASVEAAGPPPTHASTELPTVRPVDPLLNALFYLWRLVDWDATARRDVPSLVRQHVADLKPALAVLYDQVHHST